MSTIAATNLKNASSGSNNIVLGASGQTTVNGDFLFNSGYGSAATAYGCRAWVNFNGTGVVAIRASGNVSSITDNGTGDYTVNFTTAMPDANYCPTIAMSGTFGASGIPMGEALHAATSAGTETAPTTSAMRFLTWTQAPVLGDMKYINVAIFR